MRTLSRTVGWSTLVTAAAILLTSAGTSSSASAASDHHTPQHMVVSRQAGKPVPQRPVHEIDARAAAGVAANVVKPNLTNSFYSGPIASGASATYYWTNVPAGVMYNVGLSPTGATTSSPCEFQVTRSWYTETYAGVRQFHWDIKNIGAITCGTDVDLAQLATGSSWSIGGLAPGSSITQGWTNNPLNTAYLVGLTPAGATSADDCKMQVTDSWYTQESSGVRRFYFTIENIGTIACSATIDLASKTTTTYFGIGTVAAGATHSTQWNNANPLTTVFLPGVNPFGAGLVACVFDLHDSFYRQRINTDGSAEREFAMQVSNNGTTACTANVVLAGMA